MTKAMSFQNEIPSARVNIRLSVEGAGEIQKRELPLKLLVLGRFIPSHNTRRIGEREKWLVNRDNLDGVMASLGLELRYTVSKPGFPDDVQMPVCLRFTGMRSFEPAQVARQIPELGRLQAARNLIRDLGSHLLDNRSLRRELELLLKDTGERAKLRDKLATEVKLNIGVN